MLFPEYVHWVLFKNQAFKKKNYAVLDDIT